MIVVKICVLNKNDMVDQTIQSISNFPKEWNGIKFVGQSVESADVLRARNDLLWGSGENVPFDDTIDYYLFWDSDVVAKFDDFIKMYELQKPVVFGLYPYKPGNKMQGKMVGGKYLEEFPGCSNYDLHIDPDTNRIYEGTEYFGGFGFCLISKELLKRIEYPWVESRVIKVPPDRGRYMDTVFDDIGFCLKLRDYGIPVVLDGRLNLQHIPR